MRLKTLDLIAAMLVAAINVGLALLPYHFPIVNIIFGLPLVFVLPGYTLTEALFKHPESAKDPLIRKPVLKIERPFGSFDRLILSLGLSLATDILSGLILDMLPIGLQPLSWAVLLGFLTTVFSFIAAFRRKELKTIRTNRQSTLRWSYRIIYKCVVIGLALTVATSSVLYATFNAEQQQKQSFTQFWMLPTKQSNNICAVLLGVHSYESANLSYRIEVTINAKKVAAWGPFALEPQDEWDQLVSVKPDGTTTLYIKALLYRLDQPRTVYREVHVTLNTTGGGSSQNVQC